MHPLAAVTMSGHLDTRTAATEAAIELHEAMGPGADVVFVFASFHHATAMMEAAEIVRSTVNPGHLIGVTAESVIAGGVEREGLAGFVVQGMRLPGARLHPWTITRDDGGGRISDESFIRERLGVTDDFRTAIVLADPFTTPVSILLPAIHRAGGGRSLRLTGGMASGGSRPGMNVLIHDEHVTDSGVIGLSVSGDIDVDFVVSQGCRPLGTPFVVTKAKGNVISELGGRPPLELLRSIAQSLPESDRQHLSRGVLLGVVIDEYKPRFGRGDFLIRNILGIDQKRGAIAIGDRPRIGQTVQFHVRDAHTASEDLQLLLDGQMLRPRPFAAMLFTCNGRGTRLFDRAHHDAAILHDRLDDVPLAGFFAAGEIGPIGARTYFHGQTASAALFRSPGTSAPR
jgi:small ligand-binding sensory domain FIST